MEIDDINNLLRDLWEVSAIRPTHLFVSPKGERAMMRILFPSMPVARTTKMRRLRKLKYRRHP